MHAQVSRYLTPSIKASALLEGMDLSLIDYTRPLVEQGSFNAIIHKLRPNLGAHAAGGSLHGAACGKKHVADGHVTHVGHAEQH